jgi:superoxide dismutase, Fe-Mn family
MPDGRLRDRNRRDALRAAATLAAIATVAGPVRAAVAAAKEAGLSYEGLLKGTLGFQPRQPAPLPVDEIPGFLSRAQLARTYSVYRHAFDDLLAAETALRGASQSPADPKEYALLRNKQVTSANAVLLYEFYLRNLAARPVQPGRYIRGMMNEHMGTFEAWREDFTICGRVAKAWAVLVYDPYDDRWHNLPLGSSNAGGMVGNNPLVVCNVTEDAWAVDYKTREAFIRAFLEHLDWDVVAARYRAVDRK